MSTPFVSASSLNVFRWWTIHRLDFNLGSRQTFRSTGFSSYKLCYIYKNLSSGREHFALRSFSINLPYRPYPSLYPLRDGTFGDRGRSVSPRLPLPPLSGTPLRFPNDDLHTSYLFLVPSQLLSFC